MRSQAFKCFVYTLHTFPFTLVCSLPLLKERWYIKKIFTKNPFYSLIVVSFEIMEQSAISIHFTNAVFFRTESPIWNDYRLESVRQNDPFAQFHAFACMVCINMYSIGHTNSSPCTNYYAPSDIGPREILLCFQYRSTTVAVAVWSPEWVCVTHIWTQNGYYAFVDSWSHAVSK